MDSLFYIYTIIGLFVVIVLQMIERYFLLEREDKEKYRLLDELSIAQKAVIAKNANDYLAMRAMDKTIKEEPRFTPESDEEDVTQLDDDAFDRMIKKQVIRAK